MTYPLHLNIGDDLEEFLRAFAGARDLTISAAVRLILREREASEKQGTKVYVTPADQIGEITR
jgi:hypothetical protein